MALDPDFIPAVEIEERYEAEARPHLESMLDAVAGVLRNMPDLLRELRRLDEENDRLRAENAADRARLDWAESATPAQVKAVTDYWLGWSAVTLRESLDHAMGDPGMHPGGAD